MPKVVYLPTPEERRDADGTGQVRDIANQPCQIFVLPYDVRWRDASEVAREVRACRS